MALANNFPTSIDSLQTQVVDNPDVVNAVNNIEPYLLASGIWSLLGKMTMVTKVTGNGVLPRTNLFSLGVGAGLADTVLAATGVSKSVAIPVLVGDVISKVSYLVGGTAEATGTHAAAGIYSGVTSPQLLGQSTDLSGATAVGPISALFTFTLATPVTITAANAPNGFIYTAGAITATTVATVATGAAPAAAVGYKWTASGPLFIAATHDTAFNGVFPTTMGAQTAVATAPIVFLT